MEDGKLRPANYWETSTYIVKLPSDKMPGLMEYEYMSIVATHALLPTDMTVNAQLTKLHLRDGKTRDILSIERFDRTAEGGKIHFEELNQRLGKASKDRYEGAYSEIANYIREAMEQEGVKQFYARLLSQFLLGNTDSHFKNFALFGGDNDCALTPNYDLAPTVNFQKSHVALGMRGEQFSDRNNPGKGSFTGNPVEYDYDKLDARILVTLGREFGLSNGEIKTIISELKSNIPAAIEAVMHDPCEMLDQLAGHNAGRNKQTNGHTTYREDFCNRIEGRWQKLFGGVDKYIERLESKTSQCTVR